MNRPDPDACFDSEMPPILSILAREIGTLEAVSTVLEVAQELTPRPTLTEIHLMRIGARPLTRAAYLIGRLQRTLILLEVAASDLQSDLDGGLDDIQSLDPAEVDFNAIEAALERFLRPIPNL